MEIADLEWRELRPTGFNAYVGPMRFAPAGEGLWMTALDLDARHMNMGGVCHGGVYMTLADVAMGAAAYEAGGRHPCATVDFEAHFLAAAKRGQTLLAAARLGRLVGGLAFMECEVTAGGRRCLRASGIWKFLASRAPAGPGERGAGPESSA
jgi:uncharacterized protein (TIGR00369 family)